MNEFSRFILYHTSSVIKSLFTSQAMMASFCWCLLNELSNPSCLMGYTWCTAQRTIARYTYLSPQMAQLTYNRSGCLCSGCSVSHPSEAFSHRLSISKLPVPCSFASECPSNPPFLYVEVHTYKETSLSDTHSLSLYEHAGEWVWGGGGGGVGDCCTVITCSFSLQLFVCAAQRAVSMAPGDLISLYNSLCLPPSHISRVPFSLHTVFAYIILLSDSRNTIKVYKKKTPNPYTAHVDITQGISIN